MNVTSSIKFNTQESNSSQEALQTNNLSPKDSNQIPTEEEIKSQARNKMISQIRDNCLEMYAFVLPIFYYTPILCGTYACIRRKPHQIVPLLLGVGAARNIDYSITELVKNGLNIADGMERDVRIKNKTLFEYCTTYNAEKNEFYLNWSMFVDVIHLPTEIVIEKNKYYADHFSLRSKVELQQNKPQVQIANSNLCNLL